MAPSAGREGEDGRLWLGGTPGVLFRSHDGGQSWQPNEGILVLHPARPERLWQQNHCGVSRSDDRGATWEPLDGNGLPSGFGFTIMLNPNDPDVAYVIPEIGAENLVTVDGRLGMWCTHDAGESREQVSNGLPDHAWSVTLREASLRLARPRRRLLRHPERHGLGFAQSGRRLDRGRPRARRRGRQIAGGETLRIVQAVAGG